MTDNLNNDNNNIERKPSFGGSTGTGALSSIIFLIVVIIFMAILAHFKGS